MKPLLKNVACFALLLFVTTGWAKDYDCSQEHACDPNEGSCYLKHITTCSEQGTSIANRLLELILPGTGKQASTQVQSTNHYLQQQGFSAPASVAQPQSSGHLQNHRQPNQTAPKPTIPAKQTPAIVNQPNGNAGFTIHYN